MERVSLKVDGMSCGHCVHAVQKAIAAVPGAKVEHLEIGAATVSFDPAQASVGALLDAVADAGYEAQAVG